MCNFNVCLYCGQKKGWKSIFNTKKGFSVVQVGFNTLFTRVVLVKLGGKFHEKPSKGEGLWRVAEMATKNAMFIGQPHTQRHLWRKRNGQKLD